MDLQGPIPFRAAQAYGMRPNGPARTGAVPGSGANAIDQPSAPGASRKPDGTIEPPFAERRDHVSVTLASLVSGKVESPVGRGAGFEQPAPTISAQSSRSSVGPVAAPGAYAMYTRAADRVEAATAVSIGRTLDARG